MSPQWIPQNLQKRLLLYILQQLSLFSEIDLPNLEEVSLSNIQLKNVSLDPEKVGKLPGCTLRFGELKTVEVKGGMVGGVNVAVTGVDIVLAPKIDDLDKELRDIQVSLAQSTANLANTVVFESDLHESSSTILQSESDSDSDSESSRPSSGSSSGQASESPTRPSALGGVMSKALEIALSRLSVNFTDVNIKLVSEAADLFLFVKSISFSTDNRQHFVKVEGVRASTLKSGINPGSGGTQAEETKTGSDSEDHDTASSEDDSLDESLMSSTVFTHEEASSVYMSATANSFSKTYETSASDSSNAVNLLVIDSMDLTFEGISPMSNLRIDIDSVRSAAVPLVPTVSLIVESITKMLKLKAHQLRKSSASTRASGSPRFPNSPDVESHDGAQTNEGSRKTSFDKLHIGEFLVSLTSALSDEGEFLSDKDEVTIACHNINLKERDEALIFGGIETIQVLRQEEGEETSLFAFVSEKVSRSPSVTQEGPSSPPPPQSAQQNRADLRFELFKTESGSSEVTVLLSKPANCNLDPESLSYILNFVDGAQLVVDKLNSLMLASSHVKKAKQTRRKERLPEKCEPKAPSSLVFQSSSISIHLHMTPLASIGMKIFPIAYNTNADNLSIQRIVIESTFQKQTRPLFTISGVNYKTTSETLTAYFASQTTSSFRKEKNFCKSNLHIGNVEGSITGEDAIFFKKDLLKFLSILDSRSTKVNSPVDIFEALSGTIKEPRQNLQGSLASSKFLSQRRYPHSQPKVSFNERERETLKRRLTEITHSIQISNSTFTVFALFPRFGDLKLQVEELKLFKFNGFLNGFIRGIDVSRLHQQAKVKESLLEHMPDSGPMITLHHDSSERGSSTDITVRKVAVNYYTHWIQLFERGVPQSHPTEDIIHASPSGGSTDHQRRTDIRINFCEVILGLHPGRLSSEISLAVEKGTSDLTFAKEQFYIKSSFRNLSLFLIDDSRNLRPVEPLLKKNTELSASQLLAHRGFLSCGHINTTHVGVTVNTDVEAIKARNDRLGIHGDISLLDIKVNSDEHTIELCADSCQTMLQSLNDLKVPVTFKEEERSRSKCKSDFIWPNDLIDQIVNLQQSPDCSVTETPPPMPQRPGDKISESRTNEYEATEIDIGSLCIDEGGLTKLDFTDEHFRDNRMEADAKIIPMSLTLNISKAKLEFYDGYDWKSTRKTLREAVKNIEKRAEELRAAKLEREREGIKNDMAVSAEDSGPKGIPENEVEDEGNLDEDDVKEVLFQSIYLGMPGDSSTSNLVASMNSEMQAVNKENAKDEALYPNLNVDVNKQYKELKLRRSKVHKVSADVRNVEVYVHNFTNRDPRIDSTPKELEKELVNEVEVRIDSITVFDNVPSSSWNKLLTYMNVLGEREVGTYMLQFSMMNVRPDPTLPYTEVLINVKVLPLRLYIDQDTLMFLGRFFQFKDNRFNLPVDEPPFIQRLEVSPIRLKFDYKPKALSYAGFRARESAQLANLFILDSSDLKLARIVVHGILGFPNLGLALRDVYVPYIQKYQLAGLLSGLTPVKSLINIGEGIKNLIAVPYKEYKKDGQLMKSFQKSSKSFTKRTSSELLKLGVKLASGTQVMLETGEQYVGGEGNKARRSPNMKVIPKKPRSNSNEFHTLQEDDERRDLLHASQMLKESASKISEPYADGKLYSVMSMDEVLEEEDSDSDGFVPSVLVLEQKGDDASGSESEEESTEEDLEPAEKVVSLYSNQPTTTKEGMRYAYKSIGKSLKSTKKTIIDLTEDLKNADSLSEGFSSIAKASPIIVIRPMIGTTEAIMKTLMGLSNEIDPTYLIENQDKYDNENGSSTLASHARPRNERK